MSISRARTIAFDVLLRVVKKGAYADEALRGELGATVKLEDAGLATELVFGVLRWQRLLDFLIDHRLSKTAKTLDPEVRIALRLGVYQLAFLERVPARAAVHESVELVKRARKRSAATLVNAVLRKFAEGPRPERTAAINWTRLANGAAPFLPDDLPWAEKEGILGSHPTWLVERWLKTFREGHSPDFAEGRTRALLAANNRIPSVSASVLAPDRFEQATRSLEDAGCRILPGRLLRDARVLSGGNPGASEAARHGWVALQDEASQAVAGLVSVDPGNSVLDLCAAPGGKTLLLSHAAGPQGRVVAGDLHEHRVRAMRKRFEQAAVRNVETMLVDGTQPLSFERPFDRILVDAPCSGTGTLARHPEIRWKLTPADLEDLHERQVRLLENALPHLAAQGRLVYSTCSLEPEENELVVRKALQAFGESFQTVDPRPAIEGLLQPSVKVDTVVSTDGFFRTFPPQHETDGFFAAVIERQDLKA
jgi:16S rRNA (cytosine967-C5)-methyltransferase